MDYDTKMGMKTIYLSPHLDDAVFSCGGYIWEQTQMGVEVEIWTICAGDPPPGPFSELARSLHESWNLGENAVQIRREEDDAACRLVGAVPRHFSFPDFIYRFSPQGKPYYQVGADLSGGLDPGEADLIEQIKTKLEQELPPAVNLIVPLGIGNHVDHELTRKAASRLGRNLVYYADYPYARELDGQEILRFMGGSREWKGTQLQVSEKGLDQWWVAACAYGSQLSTFWEDQEALRGEIKDFSTLLGGMTLWEALEEDV